MEKHVKKNLVAIAALVGFFGDALLQIMVANGMGGTTGWGLKEYFTSQGRAEALFTASGMMVMFYVSYLATGLPVNYVGFAIYGVVLDLMFRELRLFPSLDGYYKALNYFWSAFWGAVPMILPLLVYDLLNRGKN